MSRPARLLIPRKQRLSASVKERPDKRFAVYFDSEVGGVKTRARKFFATSWQAYEFCEAKRAELAKLGESAIALTDDLKAEALACHRKLARLTDKGRAVTLTQAVDAFIRDSGLASTSLTLRQAFDKYLEALATKDKSLAYRKAMRFHLAPLVEEFGGDPVATVKRGRVKMFLERLFASKPLAPASRNNFRNYIATFFAWTVKAEMRDDNPANGLEQDDNPAKPARLLTPADLGTIFASTSPALLPAIALQALCGVRVAEVARVQWNDIEEGTLFLVGTKTKTGLDRSTPIPPALARYLETQRARDGQAYVFPFKSFANDPTKDKDSELVDFNRFKQLSKAIGELRRRVREKGGVKWENNALRASALSYRVAIVSNAHQVAEEMGNSQHILKRVYQQSRVKKADAVAWFATDPLRPGGLAFRSVKDNRKAMADAWSKLDSQAQAEAKAKAEGEARAKSKARGIDPDNPED